MDNLFDEILLSYYFSSKFPQFYFNIRISNLIKFFCASSASMNTPTVYIVISLTITLWQPIHTAHLRKPRYATDFEDDPMSRKLVEKSVFIAPTFRCPPGHVMSYDSKCLRIIRISLDNQYEFILARLNSQLNSERDIFKRNKKDIQKNIIETTTTSKPQSSSNAPQRYNNIRPMKNKHKINRDTEGPLKIQIPISGGK